MCRYAAQDEQIREHVDHVVGIQRPAYPDRKHLAGKFIDNVEYPGFAVVVCAVLDKIISPNMVGPLRPQPNA